MIDPEPFAAVFEGAKPRPTWQSGTREIIDWFIPEMIGGFFLMCSIAGSKSYSHCGSGMRRSFSTSSVRYVFDFGDLWVFAGSYCALIRTLEAEMLERAFYVTLGYYRSTLWRCLGRR